MRLKAVELVQIDFPELSRGAEKSPLEERVEAVAFPAFKEAAIRKPGQTATYVFTKCTGVNTRVLEFLIGKGLTGMPETIFNRNPLSIFNLGEEINKKIDPRALFVQDLKKMAAWVEKTVFRGSKEFIERAIEIGLVEKGNSRLTLLAKEIKKIEAMSAEECPRFSLTRMQVLALRHMRSIVDSASDPYIGAAFHQEERGSIEEALSLMTLMKLNSDVSTRYGEHYHHVSEWARAHIDEILSLSGEVRYVAEILRPYIEAGYVIDPKYFSRDVYLARSDEGANMREKNGAIQIMAHADFLKAKKKHPDDFKGIDPKGPLVSITSGSGRFSFSTGILSVFSELVLASDSFEQALNDYALVFGIERAAVPAHIHSYTPREYRSVYHLAEALKKWVSPKEGAEIFKFVWHFIKDMIKRKQATLSDSEKRLFFETAAQVGLAESLPEMNRFIGGSTAFGKQLIRETMIRIEASEGEEKKRLETILTRYTQSFAPSAAFKIEEMEGLKDPKWVGSEEKDREVSRALALEVPKRSRSNWK